eukprot:CAMPEP_0113387302 /NCGR_PEP_ID=MMETSP0013_2-20120614/8463_1 /TAXON_ID=2843 ORGANISM="Skeletonema costatum, Strain 1716" /NCGR_SAMPLE_ID=MMETSP0013_2 /ASSEMBLY_ACC=CAM_ASM_000158 /LENGTH=229 /DNA_ID=CAMNT_0000270187 /DNA_START=45 /DNA_END=734 /DNA_ORIENTATION=+ /assembly_acc=CAM_ASM_000158
MTRLHQQLLYIAALASATLLSADALNIIGSSGGDTSHKPITTNNPSRRNFVHQFGLIAAAASSMPTMAANAVDAQFKEVGQQERPPEGESPFSTLPNGVQIKDFRQGSGSTVQNGSRVELTMKGRLLNLNGVIFYDTKSNDPNGFGEGTPLQFTVGDKSVLPGLESGLIGMSRGGIRRIIVPAEVGYGAFPSLEPQPLTDVERRALDSVVKNPRRDQTVMFDCKVERLK